MGVVTKPFSREGKQRLAKAEEGIRELKKHVDSLIVIPNDRLISLAGKSMSILDAFKPSDDVLRQAVQGISEVIHSHGMINVDFADVKAIMSERGMAMMGIGIGNGDDRADDAATDDDATDDTADEPPAPSAGFFDVPDRPEPEPKKGRRRGWGRR